MRTTFLRLLSVAKSRTLPWFFGIALSISFLAPATTLAANTSITGGTNGPDCNSGGYFTPSSTTINSGDTVTISVPANDPYSGGLEIHGFPEGNFTILPGNSHTTVSLTTSVNYYGTWPSSGCMKGSGTVTVTAPVPSPPPAPSPAPTPAPAPSPSPSPRSTPTVSPTAPAPNPVPTPQPQTPMPAPAPSQPTQSSNSAPSTLAIQQQKSSFALTSKVVGVAAGVLVIILFAAFVLVRLLLHRSHIL